MRVHACFLGTMFGLLVAGIATADELRAPLPVDHVARLPEHCNLPLIAIGRLPEDSASAVDWSKLDDAYYASFRDNQFGKNDRADRNVADHAEGKLKLLAPAEGREVIVAVAVPDLPNTAVTIGPVLLDGSVLRIVAEQWQSAKGIARSKTTNAHELHLLYLPPMQAGAYRVWVDWRVMSPARPGEGSDYLLADTRVAELPFQIRPAGPHSSDRDPGAASLPVTALRPMEPLRSGPPAVSRMQVPWLVTARRILPNDDVKEGIAVGSCEPFEFLRGDPSRPVTGAALPGLRPPTSDKAIYARIVGPALGHDEWASVDNVTWTGTRVTIDCSLWRQAADGHSNGGERPMLRVELVPPTRRASLLPVTPPGKYNVEVRWHHLTAQRPGEWYMGQVQRSESASVEVK